MTPPQTEGKEITWEDLVTPIFDFEMGQRLALMRMAKLLTQKELAPRLGLNAHTLGQIEAGNLATPQHPFSLARLEEVFSVRAARFILMNRYRADYDLGGIRHKYQRHLMATRKPRAKGEHWTTRRLRLGLPMRGTFENIDSDAMERAANILEESRNKHTKPVKRKDKKPGNSNLK